MVTALRQKLLFVADFSISEQDVRENLYRFAPYDVDVDIVEIPMGADENERAQYILKTETAGPVFRPSCAPKSYGSSAMSPTCTRGPAAT